MPGEVNKMLVFWTKKNQSGTRVCINEDDKIGRPGKEGCVYQISQSYGDVARDMCAKIFHSNPEDSKEEADRALRSKQEKIEYMIEHQPPEGGYRNPIKIGNMRHMIFAWPIYALYDSQNKFQGYIMGKSEGMVSLSEFFKVKERRKQNINLEWPMKLKMAKNLCEVFRYMHLNNIYGIDGNTDNFLVNKENGLLTLIDTDSFQLKTDTGYVYENHIGFPDILPPEYRKGNHASTKEGDFYILAFFIFKLLMDNWNPFVGKLTGRAKKEGITMEDLDIIASGKGWFAYEENGYIVPPPKAPDYYKVMAPCIRKLFYESFVEGVYAPQKRPGPLEWNEGLTEAEKNPYYQLSQSGNATAVEIIYPTLLLLDVTPSLTRYKDKLIAGFDAMLQGMRDNSNASAIEFALVEFADPPETIFTFKPVLECHKEDDYKVAQLRGDYTKIDEAVAVGYNIIMDRIRYYQENNIAYKKPKMILMTDGSLNDGGMRNLNEFLQKHTLKHVEVICIAIGQPSDRKELENQRIALQRLATDRKYIQLNNPVEDLGRIFNWLSASVNVRKI